MKASNIIVLSILAIFATLVITLVSMFFTYNNKEVGLREKAEAQRGNIEAVHDEMWKTLKQEAQVTDEYKNAFEEIYPKLIEGRYSQGDGSLMKWIQESNPNFDTSLYSRLMQSIEVHRAQFTTEQKKMLDVIREHKTLCKTFPAKFFISNTEEIEYEVISSTFTKSVMMNGKDDEVDLFKK